MTDIAKVIKVEGNKVIAEVQPSDNCGSCNACYGANQKTNSLTLLNLINAKKNDLIIVEISESKSIQLSILVYIFPIIMMILGYFLGELLIQSKDSDNPFAVGLSVVFLLISFLVIYFIDKKNKGFSPQITGFYKKHSPE